jgi:hypothetical protein
LALDGLVWMTWIITVQHPSSRQERSFWPLWLCHATMCQRILYPGSHRCSVWDSNHRPRAPCRVRLYGVLQDPPPAAGTSAAPHRSGPFSEWVQRARARLRRSIFPGGSARPVRGHGAGHPMAGWPMAAILSGTRGPLVPLTSGDGWACRHGRQGAAQAAQARRGLGPFRVVAISEGGRGARVFPRCGGRKADFACQATALPNAMRLPADDRAGTMANPMPPITPMPCGTRQRRLSSGAFLVPAIPPL